MDPRPETDGASTVTPAHRMAARRMGLWIATVAMYYTVCLATAPAEKLTTSTLLALLPVCAALIGLFLTLCWRVATGRSVGAAMAWVVGYAALGTVVMVAMMATRTTYANAPLVAASWGVQLVAAIWAVPALQRARPTEATS